MLRLKEGVDPHGVQPEILLAIQIVHSIYDHYSYDCWITSLYDGTHMTNSLHSRDGICRAVDFRTTHLGKVPKLMILADIRESLGAPGQLYDIVFETGQEEHFHVEYDPKKPVTSVT